MKIEEEFITTSQLQACISEAVRNTEAGKKYVVMRYSKPVCVLIGFGEYKKMSRMTKLARGGACRVCNL